MLFLFCQKLAFYHLYRIRKAGLCPLVPVAGSPADGTVAGRMIGGLGLCHPHREPCEGAVAERPRLQGDRVNFKVLQQVKDGVEPDVLQPGLAVWRHSDPHVLSFVLKSAECRVEHVDPMR